MKKMTVASMSQNRPNPFNATTVITCEIPENVAMAFLCVYDLNGGQKLRRDIRERGKARKSDDLLKRDFHAEGPLTKCVTDITEIKGKDGKLYVSAIFDCFDSSVIGLAMDTNMKAPLCVQTLENAAKAYPGIRGAIMHMR